MVDPDEDAERRGGENGGSGRPGSPRLPARIWRRSVALGREVVAAAGGLLAALGVLLVAAIFVESLVDRTINVQPLSVPKALAEDGLSPEVVALALRDRMTALAERVRRERGFIDGTKIIDPEELPDVSVPSVGLSAQALAAEVRAFFKIQNRLVVSGEIVSREGTYDLKLRLNGHPLFQSARRLPRAQLDDLFVQGARAAVGATQPYVGAVLAFDEGDHAAALALCDGIIAAGSAASEVRHARLLKGQTLFVTGRREEAVQVFEGLVRRDQRDFVAHNGLGVVLVALGRRDAAVGEYRKAIAIDRRSAFPHSNLARAYLAMGRLEDAVAEARTGVRLNPKGPFVHLVLAGMLRSAGRGAEALDEYRAAAALGPERAPMRVAIGEALRGFGLRDEAVAQFRSAIALDPRSADACRGLASALGEQGSAVEASSGCEAAAGAAVARHPTAPSAATASTVEASRPKRTSAETRAEDGPQGGAQ